MASSQMLIGLVNPRVSALSWDYLLGFGCFRYTLSGR